VYYQRVDHISERITGKGCTDIFAVALTANSRFNSSGSTPTLCQGSPYQ
jgi:hypothetical protein